MTVHQRRLMPSGNVITNTMQPVATTSAAGDRIAALLNSGKKISVKREANSIFPATKDMANTRIIERCTLSPTAYHARENKNHSGSLENKPLRHVVLSQNTACKIVSVPLDEKPLSITTNSLPDNIKVQPSNEHSVVLANGHHRSILSISTMSGGSAVSGTGCLSTIAEEENSESNCPSLCTLSSDDSVPVLTEENIFSNMNSDSFEQYDYPLLLSEESSGSYQRPTHSYDNDSMDGYQRSTHSYQDNAMDGCCRTKHEYSVPDAKPKVRFAESLTTVFEFKPLESLVTPERLMLDRLSGDRTSAFLELSDFLKGIAPYYNIDANCYNRTPLVVFNVARKSNVPVLKEFYLDHKNVQNQLNNYSKALYSVSEKSAQMNGSVSSAINTITQEFGYDDTSESMKLVRSRRTGDIVISGNKKADFYFEYLKRMIDDECDELQEVTNADWMN